MNPEDDPPIVAYLHQNMQTVIKHLRDSDPSLRDQYRPLVLWEDVADRIEWLEKGNAAWRQLFNERQAKIDELMLEYCPEEMTKEQLENWAKHQRISLLKLGEAINNTLKEKP